MNEEIKNQEKIHANVSFAEGNYIAMTGILGGVALALGFAWIVMAYGQTLGPTHQVLFLLAGLFMGGLVALTSAFFGLVIPRKVDGGAPGAIGEWIRWGMERKNWSEKRLEGLAEQFDEKMDSGWAKPDSENWSPQQWKDWSEKMKARYKGKS